MYLNTHDCWQPSRPHWLETKAINYFSSFWPHEPFPSVSHNMASDFPQKKLMRDSKRGQPKTEATTFLLPSSRNDIYHFCQILLSRLMSLSPAQKIMKSRWGGGGRRGQCQRLPIKLILHANCHNYHPDYHLTLDCDPPTSTSPVVGITLMNHHAQLAF
jgi:hypothetical protein